MLLNEERGSVCFPLSFGQILTGRVGAWTGRDVHLWNEHVRRVRGTSEARTEWLCSFLALLLSRRRILGKLLKPLGVNVSSSVKWE